MVKEVKEKREKKEKKEKKEKDSEKISYKEEKKLKKEKKLKEKKEVEETEKQDESKKTVESSSEKTVESEKKNKKRKADDLETESEKPQIKSFEEEADFISLEQEPKKSFEFKRKTIANENKKRSVEQTENTAWVGNLPYFVTEDVIRAHFKECGKIENVRIPSFQGKGKGFAYVQFQKKEGLDAAILMCESELEGRKLLIKDANDFTRGEKKETGPSYTLFIRQLSYTATPEMITEALCQYGEIKSIRIPTIPGTKKIKGFAYVDFEKEESVTNIVALGTININGRESFLEVGSQRQ